MIKKENTIRKGCKDIFNAFLVDGAVFTGKYDFPVCYSEISINNLPNKLIAYDLTKSSTEYNSCVHFYIDDQKFDGPRGIWNKPTKALERLKKFDYVISPDFSTNIDFPKALKIYNFYRMRAFSYFLLKNGIKVINNVRWSTPSSYDYCFDGIPKHNVVAIGTVGCIKQKKYWKLYQQGLDEMIKRIEPPAIIVYGSVPDRFFKKYKENGIIIKEIPCQTSLAFKRGVKL
jgi:hypothetical protein